MDEIEPDVKRFGDRNAPRWISGWLERNSRIVRIATFSVVLLFCAVIGWKTIQDGVPTRVIGMVIGIPLTLLIVSAGLVVWDKYWAPLKSAYSRVTREHSTASAIAARLPRLSADIMKKAWPWPPDSIPASAFVVIVADDRGIRVIEASDPHGRTHTLDWDEITGIERVEYVENDKAYEGLAIFGPAPDRALVIKPVRPIWIGVLTPHGDELNALAAKFLALRR